MKKFIAQTGVITVAAAGGPITLLQLLAGSGYPVEIYGIGWSFEDYAAGDEAPLLEAIIQTSAGTGMTALAAGAGLDKFDSGDGTIQASALYGPPSGGGAAEPTTGTDIKGRWLMLAAEIILPEPITLRAAERLGLRYTAYTAFAATRAVAHFLCRE